MQTSSRSIPGPAVFVAEEVSHDIIAAIIGTIGLILVASIPLIWKRLSDVTRRQDLHEIQETLNDIRALVRTLVRNGKEG